MSARSLRMFWWTLIVFVPLLTIFSGTYAYQAVARYGDDVSFTSCPAAIAYPQEGPCVAALQQLLNADPPHAGIYHDGIFGPQTLAATRQFQSSHGLPADGAMGKYTYAAMNVSAQIRLGQITRGTMRITGQLVSEPPTSARSEPHFREK